MMMRKFLLSAATALALAGCSGTALQKPADPTAPAATSSLPPEVMYQVLVAELLAQRGDYDGAYKLLEPLVRRLRDPELAQWLFTLSMQTYDLKKIEAASLLWHDIEPKNPTPLRAAWLLALRQGNLAEALNLFDQYQQVTPESLDDDLLLAGERVAGAIRSKAAETFVEALLKRYGTHWGAHVAAGQILAARQQWDRSLAALRRALELDAPPQRVHPLLVRTYLAAGRHREGLEALADYVRAHPEDWQTQAEYARLEVATGQFREAEARFLAVLKQKPNADVARLALGLLRLERGDYAEAEQDLKAVLDNPITAQTAAYYLGQLYEKQGKVDEAIKYYAQVQHPKYQFDAQLRMVRLLYPRIGLKKALALLDKFHPKDLAQQIELLLTRAQLYQAAGDRAGALATASKVETLAADDVQTLLTLSALYYDLKAYDRYEALLRKVLTLAPDNPEALNALGYFYVEQNRNLDEAKQLLEKALKRSPDSYYILDSVGWLYYRLGDLDKAADYLRRALALQADEEVLAHLLEVEAARGDRQAVEQLLRKYDKLIAGSEMLGKLVKRLRQKP
ncbi:tetratricopeptide repeat protein [Sulfurivirga caldicuralii]|nr:tetratricopeptide repeat protein [Sulfurivirga caldicuralii]